MTDSLHVLEHAVEDYFPDPEAALRVTIRKSERRRRRRRASILAVALGTSAVTAIALFALLGPAGASHPGAHRPSPTEKRLVIGDTKMPPGFVSETVISSSRSELVLQAPPGVIRWTLDGVSCSVDYTWLQIPKGGSPGGGGGGGATCPWAPHLSIGAGGSYGSNGALFSAVGGRVLPATGVRVRVRLANGSEMTVLPHASMWLVIVQRCGDYEGTQITSVELVGEGGSVIDKQAIDPEPTPSPNPWHTWPPC
jgi:hypothetical protein